MYLVLIINNESNREVSCYACRPYASFLRGARSGAFQGHQGIFSLVKGTLWGNCKFLLEHFKGTKAMIGPSREKFQKVLTPSRAWTTPVSIHYNESNGEVSCYAHISITHHSNYSALFTRGLVGKTLLKNCKGHGFESHPSNMPVIMYVRLV